MTLRLFPGLLSGALLVALSGCEQRTNLVYVLEEPQSVELSASATPPSVQQGETAVLRVQRRTVGKWRQVPMNEVRQGQCWVYQPPPQSEPEVADAVAWRVVPENAVSFNREYRMDHVKVATMNVRGTIELTPVSTVKCEPERVVEGPTLKIEVS